MVTIVLLECTASILRMEASQVWKEAGKCILFSSMDCLSCMCSIWSFYKGSFGKNIRRNCILLHGIIKFDFCINIILFGYIIIKLLVMFSFPIIADVSVGSVSIKHPLNVVGCEDLSYLSVSGAIPFS